MEMRKKIIFLFLSIAILCGVFYGGIYVGKLEKVCPVCPPSDVDFSLFWEAWAKIKAVYAGRDNLDVQKMVYGAISGMVESLKDPYTVFFKPQDSKRFQEDVSGVFDGIGVEIGLKDNKIVVISPLEGTPAQKAGLRAADVILKVNGTSTAGMTTDEAANIIRGPKGTDVTLTISRLDLPKAKDITITRDTIVIPSVKLEFKTLPDGSQAAYIALYQFSEKAYYDFYDAAVQVTNKGTRKIILDLRNNPGGYLEVAQSIAGWFLERDKVVVMEDLGNNQERTVYQSKGPSYFSDYPVVILINEGSASASEILAGAIKDNRPNVQLVGKKSFGKGSVQVVENLSDGSSIKVTIAKWLTPNGNHIDGTGLNPDKTVDLTDQDFQQNKDPQLDAAIEILKGL
jgi:carboxyl-terminal processing protease